MPNDYQNPLLLKVIAHLRAQPSAISEHDLMIHLTTDFAALSTLSEAPGLALFQKHFLLMNALYQWQIKLWQNSEYLHISALKIAIQPLLKTDSDLPTLEKSSLRDYYLDWRNFLGTTETDVTNLLDTFWQRYYAQEKIVDAWAILGLEPSTDWPTIKNTYRRLIADKHPDRGGSSADFIVLREAYEALRKAYDH